MTSNLTQMAQHVKCVACDECAIRFCCILSILRGRIAALGGLFN